MVTMRDTLRVAQEGGKGAAAVDVTFPLCGQPIPADHGFLLYQALKARLPWIDEDESLAVHTINGSVDQSGRLLLGRRSGLVLRIAASRVGELDALAGCRLDVESGIDVGGGKARAVEPNGTLYSHFVCTGSPDEEAFMADVRALLGAAGIECGMICGRAQSMRLPEGTLQGFSLLLHGLSQDDSLSVLANGLGEGRKYGCGIFVPHKSLAAVGAA